MRGLPCEHAWQTGDSGRKVQGRVYGAGVAPWWVYFLCGFAVLAYLHLDCLDGKQARRTKSSSPLGQLFDHGARLGYIVRIQFNDTGAGGGILGCC